MIKNLAFDDAENLTKIHEQAGETVQIEIVAFGPGLNMVRSDTSPVRDRLTALVDRPQPITFPGRNNTLGTQSKQESKGIGLSPEAFLVSAGIGRVVELQERGGPVSVHR